ncbi:7 transmembrane receptor, partial [Ostertagia ostertagi]
MLYSSRFSGWEPPLDATVIERRREYISNLLFVVMSFLALIGISLAFIFLFVNIRYRNHRFIKMSSPNLNNLIIVGSMCTFASVKSWNLCLGFTLAFGAMFSKTWRVHSIFTNIRMDRKAIKDSKLLLILAGLLFVDILVLTLWAVISPFRMSVMELPQLHFDDRVVIPEIEKCESNHSAVFQAVLYATKGILMQCLRYSVASLLGNTRHVNVPALNDSKYIGMSVYNVVVMSILGLSISVILQVNSIRGTCKRSVCANMFLHHILNNLDTLLGFCTQDATTKKIFWQKLKPISSSSSRAPGVFWQLQIIL